MASRAPKPLPYRPRHRRTWLRRHDRRRVQPVPTVAAMLTVFPALRRTELERIAHLAIDRMDWIDGDPDLEWSGDEFDTGNSEDEQLTGHALVPVGPGCLISDPGGGNVEDEGQINEIEPYTGPIAGPGSRDIATERASPC
ncbi:hypothetical protein [Sphingobium yanoikuyae]|uniref:hypothetical protein n=1 Tax=Sphingobium yanoikuyae TaxID=13690 RepID=UPI0028AB56C7|nr:hypothetical protein [Sphingobium yanoikuyae]